MTLDTETTGGSPPRSFVGESIAVHFEGVKAVDGVDIELHSHEILGLIGPNGAGKTTLVNALSGFAPLTTGRVRMGDEDLTGFKAHQFARRGLARTFQGVRLFQGLTALENVEVAAVCGGQSRRAARKSAEDVLESLGLSHQMTAMAGALPYGDERRLALARAVVAKPTFLLLDEPAAGLDENESDELAQTVRRIRAELDCGVMIIEHDMNVIMGICDRVHVVENGKTIAIGTPSEIRQDEAVIHAYLGTAATEDSVDQN